MVKKFILRNVAMLLCLVLLVSSTVRTTYGFIMIQSDTLTNTFIPTALPADEASVIIGIRKEVINNGGGTVGPASFCFNVTDITEPEFAVKIGDTLVTDENGNAGFEIKFRKEDIGKTFTYKVSEEKPAMEGMAYAEDQTFTVTVGANADGSVNAAPSVKELVFTNVYTRPETSLKPAPFTVVITKTVEGDSYPLEGFEFTVKNASGAVLGTAVTDSDGRAHIDFEIAEEGEHVFTVFETENGIEGMEYSAPQEVFVSASAENDEILLDAASAELDFVNVYAKPPVPTVNVTIGVSTIIKNNIHETPLDGFEFVLENSDGIGMPMSKFSDENGEESFLISGITAPAPGEIRVIELNIYQYKDDRYPELVYDETVHKIKITVTDENGDGIPETKTTIDDVLTNEVQFINRYPGADEVKLAVNIEKIIENKTELELPEAEFNFEVVDAATGEIAATAKITGEGKTSAELVFDKNNVISKEPRTFVYHIREVEGSEEGFEYDGNSAVLEITANLDEDGKPVVSKIVFNETETDEINAVFTNVYSGPEPEKALVPVSITKTVVGGASANITPDQFEFVIEEVGGESRKVKTNTSGSYSGNLEFGIDDVGKTFTYKIKETNGGRKDIVYDSAVYEFKISVSLVNGEIRATVSKDIFFISEIGCSFTNIYKPPVPPAEGSIIIPVIIEKTVIGGGDKEIGPSGFEFVLEWGDGYYENAYCETDVSDINGRASFDLVFDEKDIGEDYEFLVYETNDGLEGMVYDDTVYKLEISVFRTEDGKIAADIYLDGKDMAASDEEGEAKEVKQIVLEFENKYKVKNEGNPETGVRMITEGLVVMAASAALLILLISTDKRFRFEK